jgi:hypothetical protein
MKIRLNYVSNSSSSSFICDVCGKEACGYDICLEDYGMYCCENGHVFCEHEMNKEVTPKVIFDALFFDEYDEYDQEFIEKLKKYKDNEFIGDELFEEILSYNIEYDGREEVSSIFCPICNLNKVPESDIISYLEKRFNFSRIEIEKKIKEDFKTLENLRNKKYED